MTPVAKSPLVMSEALFGRCNEQSKHHQRLVTANKPVALASQPPWFDQPGIARDTWPPSNLTGGAMPAKREFSPMTVSMLGAPCCASICQHSPVSVCWIWVPGRGFWGLSFDAGAALVDLIDVDAHAVASMHHTFADCAAVRVAWGDLLDGLPWPQQYDVVLSNPPFHAGKQHDDAMVRAFVATAAQHLAPHGAIWPVANAFLP
jgi:hypothetical protein